VEAKQFLTPGYFAASIGDAMPLPNANALQIPIALVTSVENTPFIIVMPEVECITTYLSYWHSHKKLEVIMIL